METTNQRKEFKPIPTVENIKETMNQRKEFKPIPTAEKYYRNNESNERI